MPLTAEQLKTFDEDGYLVLPDHFSEEEVSLLRAEAEKIYREDRQERRAPPSPPTPTTRPSAASAPTRA